MTCAQIAHDIRAVTNAIFAAAGIVGFSDKDNDAETRCYLPTRKRKPMANECREFMPECHARDHWGLLPPFPHVLKDWPRDTARTGLSKRLAIIGQDGRS